MTPAILTCTLATLRRFDPNGDWHAPDMPDGNASLLDWAEYFQEMSDLTETARQSLFILKNFGVLKAAE